MQEAKNIETELISAVQKLQDATLKKIEEVKRLEGKVTKLSIENVKLQDTITNLKESLEKSSFKSQSKDKDDLTIHQEDIKQSDHNQLVSKETSESIDMSINQLKGILNKTQK